MPAGSTVSRLDSPWESINQRYRLARELQRGDSSRVFLVRDEKNADRPTALKLFTLSDGRTWSEVRAEFQTLRRLRHPQIAEVLDLGRIESVEESATTDSPSSGPTGIPPPLIGDAFLASEYVEGVDLLTATGEILSTRSSARAREAGAAPTGSTALTRNPERWKRFYETLARIALGLEAIHARGLVHHDIKPENLLLVPAAMGDPAGPRTFDAKIIDFGFTRSETTPIGPRIRGTVPYIAPEIVDGSLADGRSDLYSFGLSIIRALTGHSPFPVEPVEDWIESLRGGAVPAMDELRGRVPVRFFSLLEDLVRFDPDERISSASVLLDRLEEMGGFSLLRRRGRFGVPVPTVAWEGPLRTLENEFEHLHVGESSTALVVIDVDGGSYPHELAEEIEVLASVSEIQFARGRGRRPSRHPYQPLAGALRELAARVDLSSAPYRRFRPALSLLLPEIDPGEVGPEAGRESRVSEARLQFVDSLSDFLTQSAKECPICVVLEDFHLADDDTRRLVDELTRKLEGDADVAGDDLESLTAGPPRAGEGATDDGLSWDAPRQRRVLFVALQVRRRDGFGELVGPAGGASLTPEHCVRVDVGPLGLEQTRQWVAERLPGMELGADDLASLVRQSGGRPRLLDEFLRQISLPPSPADRLGRPGDPAERSGRKRDAGPTPGLRIPPSLGDALAKNIEKISGAELGVLEVVAVAGSPLELDYLRRLCDGFSGTAPIAADRDFASCVRRLVDLGILSFRADRSGGPEISWAREDPLLHVLAQMPAERMRTLHELCMARAAADPPGEESAAHAREAERRDTFVEIATSVARRHVACFSFGTAARLFEEVLSELPTPSTASEEAPIPPDAERIRREALRELGDLYRRSRDFPRAIEKYTVLLSLDESHPDSAHRSELYRILGEIYEENDDRANSRYFLEKSLGLAEGAADKFQLAEALLALAAFHRRQGQNQVAETYATRALECFSVDESEIGYARACLELGAVYVRRNDHDRGLQYYRKALEAARRTRNLPLVLEVGQALGVAHMARGEYDKAIEQFTRAVELATLLGFSRTMARLYKHLGSIHFNRANHVLALENFRRSLQLWKRSGDQRGVANCLNNIGATLFMRDDAAGAEKCFRRAIEIFSRLGDKQGQAAGMNNLANLLERRGDYHEALDYSFRSLETRKQLKNLAGIAFNYYRIGRIYRGKGELDKALAYADKSLRIRREIGAKADLANSKIAMAELLFVSGRPGEALRQCLDAEQDFKILENHYGLTVARELRARILLLAGEIEEAGKLLEESLAQARRDQESHLVGCSYLSLARIAAEHDEFRQAEIRLERAENIFRESEGRRDLAEVLLERCQTGLDFGRTEEASAQLERAYEILEQLGLRDLIPGYFLLRGRLEVEGPRRDLELGRKFLERALVEARDVSLPDVIWRVHLRLGETESALGRGDEAEQHFRRGREILETMRSGLEGSPPERFYSLKERRRLLGAMRSSTRSSTPEIGEDSGAGGNAAGPVEDPADDRTELLELRSLNRRLMKLQDINKAINSERDIDRLLEMIMDEVLTLLDAERGYLILTEGAARSDRVIVARNIDRKTIEDPEGKISRSIFDQVLQSNAAVLTRSAVSDDRFVSSKSVRDLQLLSVLCVPLRSRGKVIGAIYLDNRSRLHAFRETDRKLLETFCDQATLAIVNAGMAAEIRQRNADLEQKTKQMDELNRRLLVEVEERKGELELAREQMRRELSKYQRLGPFHNIVGKSGRMQQMFEVLERISPTNLPVLIQGSSGTGKELVARAVHANSQRREKRFISENCAALSDSLLESELFGHVKGSFTGATSDRAGLFEIAHGGTLFLDEVAEMSLSMQKKLLRVLQENEIRRVGDKKTVQIDVRIISASNRDLRKLVEEGEFREDLYYRLNGVRVDLPALREREEDIPLLVMYFLQEISRESDLPRKTVSPEALRHLVRYHWPGNVRELRHFLERTALLMEGDIITSEHCRQLESEAPGPPPSVAGSERGGSRIHHLLNRPLREAKDGFTAFYVERCYEENGFNATRAARACGMSRESFHRFLKKYDVRRDRTASRFEGRRRRG